MNPSLDTRDYILKLLPTEGQRDCYRYLYDYGPSRLDHLADHVFPRTESRDKPLRLRMQTASAHLTILEKNGLVQKKRILVGYDESNRKRYLTEWETMFIDKSKINEVEVGRLPMVRRGPKKKKSLEADELIADLMHLVDELVHNSSRFRAAYPKSDFFQSWVTRAKILGNKCRSYERHCYEKAMKKIQEGNSDG